jgi:hypothetical protein
MFFQCPRLGSRADAPIYLGEGACIEPAAENYSGEKEEKGQKRGNSNHSPG